MSEAVSHFTNWSTGKLSRNSPGNFPAVPVSVATGVQELRQLPRAVSRRRAVTVYIRGLGFNLNPSRRHDPNTEAGPSVLFGVPPFLSSYYSSSVTTQLNLLFK